MKVIPTPQPAFSPVTLTIVFESQSELDGLGSLLNTSSVSDAMSELFSLDVDPIAEEISRKGGDIHHTRRVYNKLTGKTEEPK